MNRLAAPPLDSVFRRREHPDAVNEQRLAAQLVTGAIVRVSPGSFARAGAWAGLSARDRHAQRVWEAAARMSPGAVFSHFAAAALWGLDILGEWPELVDVTVTRGGGGRSTGRIRRRTLSGSDRDTVPWGRHEVTTVAQTVVDIAASVPYIAGLAVADQALWARRRGGALLEARDLRRAAAGHSGRGAVRAAQVAAAATPLADSVRESQSRAHIELLGFPEPELQHEFLLSHGRRARTDFFWRAFGHVGEFDGLDKYRDPELLRGRTPQQALIEEKDREDELRRLVQHFSRWRTPALEHPARLYDILVAAGLPTSRPRPGR